MHIRLDNQTIYVADIGAKYKVKADNFLST
jgi:hypothetical protein